MTPQSLLQGQFTRILNSWLSLLKDALHETVHSILANIVENSLNSISSSSLKVLRAASFTSFRNCGGQKTCPFHLFSAYVVSHLSTGNILSSVLISLSVILITVFDGSLKDGLPLSDHQLILSDFDISYQRFQRLLLLKSPQASLLCFLRLPELSLIGIDFEYSQYMTLISYLLNLFVSSKASLMIFLSLISSKQASSSCSSTHLFTSLDNVNAITHNHQTSNRVSSFSLIFNSTFFSSWENLLVRWSKTVFFDFSGNMKNSRVEFIAPRIPDCWNLKSILSNSFENG